MRSESGLVYLEASADGQVEKVFGDASWLPFTVKPYETEIDDVLPVLVGAGSGDRLEFDFVELGNDMYADVQYQSEASRQYIWLRNASRHAQHLRAAQQVANSAALREAIGSSWAEEIKRPRSAMRLLLDRMAAPVAYWSAAGEMLYCNSAFARACDPTFTPQTLRATSWRHKRLGSMALPEEIDLERAVRAPLRISRVLSDGELQAQLLVDLSASGHVLGYLDMSTRELSTS